MILYDVTLKTPEENIALDEALLLFVEKQASTAQKPIMRLWESQEYFVVLGLSSSFNGDVNVVQCEKDKVPIIRRCSGGGTVLQGRGCLNVSFIYPYFFASKLSHISESYSYVLGNLVSCLSDDDYTLAIDGVSDLILGNKKISGNAQSRKKYSFLHHGTILYNFNQQLIPRYLQEPMLQPEYRKLRTHLDFVRNLPVHSKKLKNKIINFFKPNTIYSEICSHLKNDVSSLVKKKYLLEKWTRKNT